MPSERHINRQIQWRDTLRKYGANVSLERTIRIKGARVVVDVRAEIEGKIFLIEIGDINDERKTALMSYYAQEKPNVEFIHEPYGSNKMPQVLESISAYRNSEEYERYKAMEKMKEERIQKRQNREKHIQETALCIFVFNTVLAIIFIGLNPPLPTEYILWISLFIVLVWFGSGGLWLFSSVIADMEMKSPSAKSKAIFTSEQHRKACLKWVNTELQNLKELREEKIVEYCARCGYELPDSDEIYWLHGQPYCEDCYNDEIEETDYPFIEDL